MEQAQRGSWADQRPPWIPGTPGPEGSPSSCVLVTDTTDISGESLSHQPLWALKPRLEAGPVALWFRRKGRPSPRAFCTQKPPRPHTHTCVNWQAPGQQNSACTWAWGSGLKAQGSLRFRGGLLQTGGAGETGRPGLRRPHPGQSWLCAALSLSLQVAGLRL